MGGFQRAVALPKTKRGQHSTEITAVIDYFRDGESSISVSTSWSLSSVSVREETRGSFSDSWLF